MKKTYLHVFGALLVFGVLGLVSKVSKTAYAEDPTSQWRLYEFAGTSGTVSGPQPPYDVRRVFASSDTVPVAGAQNWFILLATSANNGTVFSQFTADVKMSPAVLFPTTWTYLNTAGNPALMLDYGPDGVHFSTHCYVFKTAASSEHALRLYLEIRK